MGIGQQHRKYSKIQFFTCFLCLIGSLFYFSYARSIDLNVLLFFDEANTKSAVRFYNAELTSVSTASPTIKDSLETNQISNANNFSFYNETIELTNFSQSDYSSYILVNETDYVGIDSFKARSPTRTPTPGLTFLTEIPEKKIINLGLPKTGTTSFQREIQYFLGGNAVSHWKDCFSSLNLSNSVMEGLCHTENMCGYLFTIADNDKENTLLSHFDGSRPVIAQPDCVSFTGFYFPQVSLLERLLEESKGRTIFTLTTRPTGDWLKSVNKWTTLYKRLIKNLKSGICEQFGFEASKFTNVTKSEVLVNFKYWHEERVKKLAAKYDEELFILDLNDPPTLRGNFSKVLALLTGQEVQIGSYEWANKKTP